MGFYVYWFVNDTFESAGAGPLRDSPRWSGPGRIRSEIPRLLAKLLGESSSLDATDPIQESQEAPIMTWEAEGSSRGIRMDQARANSNPPGWRDQAKAIGQLKLQSFGGSNRAIASSSFRATLNELAAGPPLSLVVTGASQATFENSIFE